MSMADQFKKILKDVDKKKTTALYRALNKSVAKTKTQFKKELKNKFKVSNDLIDKRLNMKKASMKSLTAYTGFATKHGFSLSEFKPKNKVEKIKTIRDKKKKRKFYTAQASPPFAGGKQLFRGAWVWNSSSGKSLVLTRKDPSKRTEKGNVKTLRLEVFTHAEALRPSMNNYFAKQFEKYFEDQLKYEMSK